MESKWKKDVGFHVPKLTLLEIWPLNTFIGDKQNLNIIDVGGNTGIWCQAFMNTFGNEVKVYHAIEPLDGNLKLFQERLYDGMVPFREKIFIHEACLGPSDGSVEIRYHSDVSTLASVVLTEVTVGNKLIANDKSKNIKQISLDSFCTSNRLENVNLIKIDVEGYEWDVFTGAKNLLKNNKIDMVLFEFGQHQGKLNQTFKQFWDLLSSNGFHIYRQAVGRNFFGMQYISSYDSSLEDFDSMWMILASKCMHDEKLNSPFVIGKYYPPK